MRKKITILRNFKITNWELAKAVRSANDVDKLLKFIKESGTEIVAVKVSDLPGQWQHFSLLPSELTEDSFERSGIGLREQFVVRRFPGHQ